MKIRINPLIENFGEAGFIASLPIKGMVAHGNSANEAKNEIIKSLMIKMAYDYNCPLGEMDITLRF